MSSGVKKLNTLCGKLMKEEKFAKAINLITEDVEKRSDLVRPLTLASACCMRLGWYEEAGDLAAAGITLDPSNAPAWYNAALSLTMLGKSSEARAVLRQAPERVKARSVFLRCRPYKMDELAFLSFQTQEPSKLVWEGLDTRATPEAMRNLGWQEWKNKRYKKSLRWWKSLIHSRATHLGESLRLRSICNFEYKQSKRALMDATTAIMLDPNDITHEHSEILSHRQTLLERLTHHNAAENMTVFISKRSEYVKQKDFEAKCVQMRKANNPAKGATSQDEKFKAFGISTERDDDRYDAYIESALGNMPNLIQQNLADGRVALFHEEFVSGSSLAYSNTEKCLKWLKKEYVDSALAPRALICAQRANHAPDDVGQMMMRLSPDPVNYKRWWDKASLGDLNTRNPFVVYPDDVYQTFSNVTPKQITLRFGKKHVAVGYVDMGILLWANIVGDEAAGPVKFVGFELSAYATSRTHILAQMLRDGASVDSILQVGYSSGWSSTCLEEFKEAVGKVLDKQGLPGSVRRILRHWKRAPNVGLLEAQERWQGVHTGGDMLANAVQKKDRLELMHYMLSGRLLDCDVGSITMFGNPPDIPHCAREEYVYWTLSPEELGENYRAYGSIMGVVVGDLKKRITKLRELMQRGLVIVDLEMRLISVEEPSVLQAIRAMDPSSMSWSNVGDYMVHEVFHTVASMCSSKHTVHHLHSMNWVRDVKGAFLVDYAGIEKRIAITERCLKESAEYIKSSIGEGIFHIPPIASPNRVGCMVAIDFSEKWCSHFAVAGGLYNVCVDDFSISRCVPSQSGPTMYITFHYLDLPQ